MTKPTYRSINMAATLLGIDRRMCILILLACFEVLRHVSFALALIVFTSLWGAAYWLTKHDPALVVVFPKVLLFQRKIYDAGKFTQ